MTDMLTTMPNKRSTMVVIIRLQMKSSNYYARIQTAVARDLGLPAARLAGHHSDAASKHTLIISVNFPSKWSRASTYICKAVKLACTDCDC